jgi:hypothetical protein
MTNSNLLPGMLDDNVEIFVQGQELKIMQSGKILPFAEISFTVISLLEEEMYQDNDVLISLHALHPHSKMKRIEQFAKCRFGGLDFHPDITKSNLQKGEYWDCPMRGTCPHEGNLCKLPSIKNKRLTSVEVKIMQLSSTEMTNDVMAEEIGLPFGTFHKIKKELYKILGIQTKQEATLLSKFFNLI